MSTWIKCDKCNKITKADSCGEKRYSIQVNGFDGLSTFHVCEHCLRSFYLDFLNWVWNDDESQYEPQESEEIMNDQRGNSHQRITPCSYSINNGADM
jgi:hypothetical protein